MNFNSPIYLTSSGLTLFWSVELSSRLKSSPLSFTSCNEFWSRNSICHFRGCSISALDWNQVQQPKYHFIISNVESCKSVKPPPCIRKNLRIAPTMALQKGVRARGSQQWRRDQVMVQWELLPPPHLYQHTATATPTLWYSSFLLYLNLRRKPHAGFWRASCG